MMTENLDAFFNSNELGVAAIYNAVSIVVILLNEYITIEGGTVGVEGSGPVALVKATDVSGIAPDDAITVDGVSYTVKRIEPDSMGGVSRLVLNEV